MEDEEPGTRISISLVDKEEGNKGSKKAVILGISIATVFLLFY
jgi:hypothetical protein